MSNIPPTAEWTKEQLMSLQRINVYLQKTIQQHNKIIQEILEFQDHQDKIIQEIESDQEHRHNFQGHFNQDIDKRLRELERKP